MTADRMTEDEFADSRERHARWSAIVTLAVCSALSIAGCVYHAAVYGSRDIAGMTATATLSVVLLLSIHLRASNAAARESDRVSEHAALGSTVGGVTLVGMALVGNFATLHALAVEKALNPLAAVLTPLALDVGVITATWTLFALRPKLARSRRAAAPRLVPDKSAASAPRPLQHKAPSAPRPATSTAVEAAPVAALAVASSAPTGEAPDADSAPESALAIDAAVARVLEARAVKQPEAVIREILAAKARGAANQNIADSIGVHYSVVGRVIAASRSKPEPAHLTAAVR